MWLPIVISTWVLFGCCSGAMTSFLRHDYAAMPVMNEPCLSLLHARSSRPRHRLQLQLALPVRYYVCGHLRSMAVIFTDLISKGRNANVITFVFRPFVRFNKISKNFDKRPNRRQKFCAVVKIVAKQSTTG